MSKNLPACHQDSPQHAAYVARVEELEAEGCDTSDAQGIADMEFSRILTQTKKPTKPQPQPAPDGIPHRTHGNP